METTVEEFRLCVVEWTLSGHAGVDGDGRRNRGESKPGRQGRRIVIYPPRTVYYLSNTWWKKIKRAFRGGVPGAETFGPNTCSENFVFDAIKIERGEKKEQRNVHANDRCGVWDREGYRWKVSGWLTNGVLTKNGSGW